VVISVNFTEGISSAGLALADGKLAAREKSNRHGA
jgi:hypothetical protein